MEDRSGLMPNFENIVLIGFMGTGKSVVGRALARNLSALHLDTDAEIVREAGKPIPRIFSEDGEEAFRAWEKSMLTRLVFSSRRSSKNGPPLMISTGGGTPLSSENTTLLREIGTIVWLQASPPSILSRVSRALSERPLLAGYQNNPLARIEQLLAERTPYYAALADLSLDTSECDGPDDVAQRILSILNNHAT